MLFSGNPSAGHILPMMPLADAAGAAGHDTALLTSGGQAGLVAPVRVLPAGPSIEQMMDETVRRTGSHPAQPGPGAVELFAGVRVDMTIDDALRQAREFGPDLVVCEELDFVGPMVAAALGIPWAAHAISGPLPEPLWQAMLDRVAREYKSRSLTESPRIALVDPYPDALRSPSAPLPADRITIQPAVNEHGATRRIEPLVRSEQPRALVSVGTTVGDSAALFALASSVAEAGYTAIVTAQAEDLPADLGRDQVLPVGFVPLAELLPQVELVVTAGGTGTVLASLSHGLPMVVRPFIADQPWNAARLAEIGAGIVIDDVTEAGAAARRIAEDPAYREAAKGVAAQLASVNTPDTVLRQLMSLRTRAVE